MKSHPTGNLLDAALQRELRASFTDARQDDGVLAVVLTGSGSSFCGGTDPIATDSPEETSHDARQANAAKQAVLRDVLNLEKPVIAAINGAAHGAGFSLALACDFLIAVPNATFAAISGRMGLVSDIAGLFLLPRIVGLQRAKEIVLSGRSISADEARHIGIVHDVRPHEELLESALELAARFHDASIEAIGMAKAIMNKTFSLDQQTVAELEASAQAIAMDSDYHKDAARRFLAKEKLRFSWPS